MRCERCKASCEVHYAESYETDWYCHAGVPEEEMNEDKNGDWGCNLHYKTIQKRVEENEKAWHKDKEQYVDWFLDRQGKKGGDWVACWFGGKIEYYRCSECDERSDEELDFCPSCFADMRGNR